MKMPNPFEKPYQPSPEEVKKAEKEKLDFTQMPPQEWTVERSAEFYSTIIKNILENPENVPEKVFIFLDKILFHTPVIEFDEAQKLGKPEKEIDRINAEKMVAEKVKEWLVKGGIYRDRVIIESKELLGSRGGYSAYVGEGENVIKEADKSKNWIITGRWAGSAVGLQNELKFAKSLNLPENDFYESVIRSGLIDNPEELKNNLNNMLSEKFGKKVEEK